MVVKAYLRPLPRFGGEGSTEAESVGFGAAAKQKGFQKIGVFNKLELKDIF
jgi:hypothetical protein